IVSVMPKTFPTVALLFTRRGRCGKLTLPIRIAEATKVSEYKMNAALVPNNLVTTPPTVATSVSITDQVTVVMALAGTNSRSETIDGIAAVFAGSKNVENASWKTVRT